MNKLLVVVDMQNDFISGSLGSKEALMIVPKVIDKINEFENVVFTMDTHQNDYLNTPEGKKLPVEHCIENTNGWQLEDSIKNLSENHTVIKKPSFGSVELVEYVKNSFDEIYLVGLCTDICVVSNALLLKAHFPDMPISVYSDCCAGVTPKSHEEALNVMKMCQIEIL